MCNFPIEDSYPVSFLPQYIMGVIGSSGSVDSDMLSGAAKMVRATATAKQTYDDNQDTWPLGKPIPKMEAEIQCSGERMCLWLIILNKFDLP